MSSDGQKVYVVRLRMFNIQDEYLDVLVTAESKRVAIIRALQKTTTWDSYFDSALSVDVVVMEWTEDYRLTKRSW